MHYIYIVAFLFLVSGCGPSGSSGDSNILSPDEQELTDEFSEVVVERGPLFFSKLIDANGTVALNSNYGYSNSYRFASTPALPVTAIGGYIDVNRNNLLDSSDTLLDINLSSYSNVITPITTLIENNSSMIEKLMQRYGLSEIELREQLPSEISKEMIIFSNAVFVSLKKGYVFDSVEFNQSIIDIKNIYNSSSFDKSNLITLSSGLEREILESLGESTLSNEILDSLDKNITQKFTLLNIENESFNKTESTTDSIENIWSVLLLLPIDQDISDAKIGVEIERVSSGSSGNIVIQGISIKNNKLLGVESLSFFGKKTDGTTSSTSFDTKSAITQNSIRVLGDKLLINLGYIINNQNIISSSSFRVASTYNLKIYSDKIDIAATELHQDMKMEKSYGVYTTFPTGAQELAGTIEVKN